MAEQSSWKPGDRVRPKLSENFRKGYIDHIGVGIVLKITASRVVVDFPQVQSVKNFKGTNLEAAN